MKVADFRVSANLLREVLYLPDGTEIIGVRGGQGLGEVIIRITHPDLRDVAERFPVPYVDPHINTRTEYSGLGRVEIPYFAGWGQELTHESSRTSPDNPAVR